MPAIIASRPVMHPRASAPNAISAAKDPGRTRLATSAATVQLQNTIGKCTSIGCTGWPDNLTSGDQYELGGEQRDEPGDREQRVPHHQSRRQRASPQMRT